MPPYSLLKTLWDRIKESYRVIEVEKLKVSEVESQLKAGARGSPSPLIVLSSLDGINQESRQCNLRLFAYKCSEQFMKEPTENFYLNADNFYAHSNFQNITSAALVRKEVEKLVKVANSPKLIKMINPARLHLSSEDELMVVLNLQEPPSVDNSFIETEEQKQEPEPVVKKETPTPAPAAPTKKQK